MLAVMILATFMGLCADLPKELTVFAAASLTGAFGEIGKMYTNETNIRVAFNFDGSQVLRTQIANGAYADIFVSANTNHLTALKNEGLLDNSSISTFTRNKPSIIVPIASPAGIHNISGLAKPGIKLAIGIKDVPIGDYTLQILNKTANNKALGPQFKAKVLVNVVSKETNVNYAVSKVALDEVGAGISCKSDVTDALSSKITKMEIPDKDNVIAEYPLAILNGSIYTNESKAFIDLVESEKVKTIL